MPYYSDFFIINLLAVILAGLATLPNRHNDSRRFKYIYRVIAIGLLVAAGAYLGLARHLPDFKNAYYPSGQLIIQDPANLYGTLCSGFVNLPIIALLFTPFTWFTVKTATVVFLIFGYIATFFIAITLLKLSRARGYERLLLLVLIAVSGPLDYNFWIGNITNFVLLVLIAAFFALDKKREFAAGVFFGVAGLLKLPLLLIPVYLLVKRRWKAVSGAAVITSSVLVSSLLLYGSDLHIYLLESCIIPLSERPISALNVQSLNGFLARILYPGSDVFSWDPFEVGTLFKNTRYIILVFIYGLTFLAVLMPSKDKSDTSNIDISLILLCALIVSPVSWTHYYMLLLLPIAFCLGTRIPLWQLPTPLFVLFFSATILISLPQDFGVLVYRRLGEGILARLAVSYYLYGGLALWIFLLAVRLRTASNTSNTRKTARK